MLPPRKCRAVVVSRRLALACAIGAALALPALGQAPCAPDAAAATASGWRAYRRNAIEAARAAFTAALRSCPADDDAEVGLGFVELRGGKLDDARRLFTAVTVRAPSYADAWDGLSMTENRRGDVPGAVAAAKRVVALDPKNTGARERLDRLAPDWDHPAGAPVRRRAAALDLTMRTAGEHFELRDGKTWRPFFLKGVDMGVALPGKFPAEFPTDQALYAGWLDQISAMHANTLRLYTILPPAFYRAVRDWNLHHPDRILYLVHGVWTEPPPGGNFDDAAFNGEYEREIRRVVDLLHGAADFPARPGHAGGRYDADVSPWVVAYIMGREWEPSSLVLYNRSVKEPRSHAGRFLTIGTATPADVWLTSRCDDLLSYEFDAYNALRPIAYTNWPTTDPITHPSETSYEQQMKFRGLKYDAPDDGAPPNEEDGPSVDPSLVHATAANPAGWFASYHVYPYYPDFILYDSTYSAARSSFGPSNYFGYLRDLERRHAGIPLMISEFGIPTSRGNARLQPQGWNHGGHDEKEAAEIDARLAAEIRESGAAGEVVFSWIDEWFKRNWLSADFEIPHENAPQWHNALSPEQYYGITAMDAGASGASPELGGDAGRWRALTMLEKGALFGRGQDAELRVGDDESYVYVALAAPSLRGRPFPFASTKLQIAIDTYRPDLGQTVLPESGLRSAVGFEFLIELDDLARAELEITPDYNPYMPERLTKSGAFFGEHFRRPVLSLRRTDGVFDPLFVLTNRARYMGDGSIVRGRGIDLGKLTYGTLAQNTLSDWWWDSAAGILELRLPWGLLNVSDPSTAQILFESDVEKALHPGDSGPFSQLVGKPSDGFRFGVVALSTGPDVLGTIPALDAYGNWPRAAFTTWKWKTWDVPTFHARLKPVYAALQRLWASP